MAQREIAYIHGANYISSRVKPAQKAILALYKAMNVHPDYEHVEPDWIEAIRSKGIVVHAFEWSGIVTPWHVSRAVRDFRNFLDNHPNITEVVSTSLGTHIALKAAATVARVRTIVSLCGVYRRSPFTGRLVDISSDADSFELFANGLMNVAAPVVLHERVAIPDRRHDEFMADFEYEGQKLSDFIVRSL